MFEILDNTVSIVVAFLLAANLNTSVACVFSGLKEIGLGSSLNSTGATSSATSVVCAESLLSILRSLF
jgi:hypothetical protein